MDTAKNQKPKVDSKAERERRAEIAFLQILMRRYPEQAKRFAKEFEKKPN